ncbi:MAG: dTMP kinase [Candidatus Helarchaeota archaeon]|nr:dTMP kinase [Candidatus Helarchaeota archaeon]
MTDGKFVVLEGIDGSGTSTHARLLGKWLRSQGHSVVVTHEPTTRKIGVMIQRNIKTEETSAVVDALLFAADRVDHLEHIIEPSLAANKIVISDRYVESSIAYQTSAGLKMDWVLEINKFVKNPDLTIIFDIEPEKGLRRKAKTGDKFENVIFLRKVREIYLQRAKAQQYPVIKTDRSIGDVQADLQNLIQTIL